MFMEQILEVFGKQISIPYTDGAGYFYIKVLCFDQDIVKFISNQISISQDGVFLSYTYEYVYK